jgi:hypothetical protein
MHIVIPGWVDALIGGALLYGALLALTPHLSNKRRLVVFVLLASAIFWLIGALVTVRIG